MREYRTLSCQCCFAWFCYQSTYGWKCYSKS